MNAIKRHRFVFILSLGLFVVDGGCSEPDAKLVTRTAIHHFDNPNMFAGMTTIGYRDAASLFKHYPKYPKATVFWQQDGKAGSTNSPDGSARHVEWSATLREYILLTLDGVYAINPMDGTCRLVWRKEGYLQRPAWAFDAKRSLVAVTGYDVDNDKYFFAIVDLVHANASVLNVEKPAISMAFANDNKILASMRVGLMAVHRSDSQEWTLTRINDTQPPELLIGVLNDVPVYREKHNILIGDHSIALDGEICRGSVVGDTIFAVTEEGRVFRIGPDRQPVKLATLLHDNIIGSGTSTDGFWLALEDGSVHVYDGQNGQERTVTITIP
ncbi:MAG: hypothetical protein FWE88_01120 [Phycisphaerae bacterium]|nr:hypothetical protein [Phycisphaerae bacterium]